jgi:predicted AAA+ superfamily ATPase
MPVDLTSPDSLALLTRIADALERLAPTGTAHADFTAADAFVWQAAGRRLSPVPKVNRVDMSLLRGIDRVRDQLAENTQRFARGLPANNALLWGARGMGKSSLVKAVHAEINHAKPADSLSLKLIEIHREDIETLPDLMGLLRTASSSSATISPSTRTIPPTSRSKPCWRAGSRVGPTM